MCGAENNEDARFCRDCGAPLNTDWQERENQYYDEKAEKNWQEGQEINSIPPEYRPISTAGYIGYSFLFAIPLVGLILAIVFSFGGTQNKNLRNFARAQLCVLCIAAVLVVIVCICIAVASYSRYYGW